jgi:long-subunit fatty acid transport protein
MMEAQITAAHFIFAGAYEYKDLVAIGLSAQAVASGWSAVLDNDTMPLLHDQINALGETSPYTDEDLEDPRYAARLSFPDLQARSFTWSAGLRAQPHPRLAFSLAHIAGYSLDQRGEMSIAMLCPPDTDAIGRFGAEKYELCDASFEGEGSVSYEVPARWHLAITGQPIDPVQIELFYTRVGWSAFEDFHIQIDQIAEQNQFESEFARENTPPLLEQDRLWARENQDAWTAGLDLKGQVHSRLRLGGRATWDRAAVPDEALSPNNYDADTLILNGNAMVQLIRPLQLGLSFSHYRVSERQVDSSAFRMAIEPEERAEDRWDYPHANGLYSTQINRVGIALLGQLGAGGSGTEGRQRAGEEPE